MVSWVPHEGGFLVSGELLSNPIAGTQDQTNAVIRSQTYVTTTLQTKHNMYHRKARKTRVNIELAATFDGAPYDT